MLTSAIEEVFESQPYTPIGKSLTIGDFTSKEIEQEERGVPIPCNNCPATSSKLPHIEKDMDTDISDYSDGDLSLNTAEVLINSSSTTFDEICCKHPPTNRHSRVSFPEQIPIQQWEYLDSDDDSSEPNHNKPDLPMTVNSSEGDGNELIRSTNEDEGGDANHSSDRDIPNIVHSVRETAGIRDSTIGIHAGGDDNPCWIQEYNDRRTAFTDHNAWIYSAMGRWTAAKRRRIGNFSAMFFRDGHLDQETLEELEGIKRDMSVITGTVLESSLNLHADASLLQTVMEDTIITFPLPVLEQRLEPIRVFAFTRDIPVKFEFSPEGSEPSSGEDSVEGQQPPVVRTPQEHSRARRFVCLGVRFFSKIIVIKSLLCLTL
jgi:hypothetical protein